MAPDNVEPPDDTDAAGHAEADAASLLDDVRTWRRRTRSARHAYWFPLVLFGLLTCAALPLYILPRPPRGRGGVASVGGSGMPILGGSPASVGQSYLGSYWLVALLGGLLLTLLWYRRHARQVGLQTPARGYVITVGVLTAFALLAPVLSPIPGLGWLRYLWPGDLIIRGTFPFLIIAAGLWVLAWVERSRGLAAVALVYTGTALLASLYDIANVLFRLGWNPAGNQWRLTSLPNVLLPALVLLMAGAGAFIVQRRRPGAA